MSEFLLSAQENRFVMYPIKYPAINAMYVKARDLFWTVDELDFVQDMRDWADKLNDDERFFIKNVLAFFSSSDSLVLENLAVRFMGEVTVPEAKAFYAIQIAVEQIHQETYSRMIVAYVTDEREREYCFNSVLREGVVKRKADWASRWITAQENFALRLAAFACVEGIFFSSSFTSIYWLKKRNLMPGLCLSNDFISRDEGLHCEFAVLLFNLLNVRPDITHIVREAAELECEFVRETLRVSLIGINATLMCQYVCFCADRLLMQMKFAPIYNATNPFDFMEQISVMNKSNFFELRPTEYSSIRNTTENDDDF